ncbi:MAG: hypothetical protein OXF56_07665 [Rhodobacteraceae bacterium]|nr:hypothetical protein [Paracoccaceae bacterium]
MQFFKDGGWLYLVPGFIALFVAGFISDFPTVRDSQLPIVYVILTLLSALIPLGIAHFYARTRSAEIDLIALTRNPFFYAFVLICSVGWGLVFGIFYTNDAISTWLRKSLGDRTVSVVSHSELLRELLSRAPSAHTDEGWRVWDGRQGHDSEGKAIRHNDNLMLIIEFKGDGRIFEGKADKWFAGQTTPQVYLSPACSYDAAGNIDLIPGPGVWVNLEDALSVRFEDTACSECAWAHDKIQGTGAFDRDPTRVVTPVCHYSDIAKRLAPAASHCVTLEGSNEVKLASCP